MPAIVHEALFFAALLAADPRAEIVEVLNVLASGLSAGNAAAFLGPIDPKTPGYAELRSNVYGLLAGYEAGASVEILTDEGDDKARDVQLDWFLELRPRQPGASTVRRRQTVTCRFERRGRGWRVVRLEPVALFAP